jgi:1,4-dihydroxy-6-naphthoate synthase
MLVATDPAPPAASPNELRDWLRGRPIAVPGKMTSAYLAAQLFLGQFEHVVVPFDQIFAVVKSGARGRLIIHEGQLTYAAAGFKNCSISESGGKPGRVCPCR